MIAAVDKVKKILESQFEIKSYVELVKEVFASVKIIAPDSFRKEFSNFSSHIKSSSHVGSYEDSDGKRLAIFAVELKKDAYVERSRSTQRSFAKQLIENGSCDAAFIAFFTEGDSKWRLSFVRLDYEMKVENGKLKAVENLTPVKRYSYLVGENEPSYTAIDRFRRFIIDNGSHPKLDEIEEAFSVEKVTKEFFDLYLEKFLELKEHLDDNNDFMIEANQHNFTSAQFAKKLMGQIVFLYFLQKKGWLGVGAWPAQINEKEYKNAYFAKGAKSRELIPIVYTQVSVDLYRISAKALENISDDDEEVLASCLRGKPWGSGPHDFMRKLFTECVKKKGCFFDDYLEPLFYDALNVNRGESGYCPMLHCRIPFLSGGLFEPINGYEWKYNSFEIPNNIFSNRKNENDASGTGILDIFDRYNFTISEDEPLEKEVAIDPEMLGKIFENLLEIKDRKSKGAFYTPREIVHYMCQESLINYITNKTGIEQADIREFILYGDYIKDEDTLKEKRVGNESMYIPESIFKIDTDGKVHVNRLADIDLALANVKVADPAVGSGAFPLGMLNEIVRARENISAYYKVIIRLQSANSVEADKKIRDMFTFSRHPYELKLNTIQNSIFAVDVEPSAVDIAQLRLWLALVIDDEIDPEATMTSGGHRNPIPLPNLECNILCGNSLVNEYEEIQLINANELLGTTNKGGQHNIFQSSFDSVLPKLIDAQNRLFKCSDTNKKSEIKQEIELLRDLIIHTQMDGCANKETLIRYEKTKKMASQPFILWQLDFARVFIDNGGFDIVIGNPPYVNIVNIEAEFREYLQNKYLITKNKVDLYAYFIEFSDSIINKDGSICFIVPQTWKATDSFVKFRHFIFDSYHLKQIVNLNMGTFEAAVVRPLILQLQKDSDINNDMCVEIKNSKFVRVDTISYNEIKSNKQYIIDTESSKFDKEIFEHVQENTIELGKILQFTRGIKTSDDKRFIFANCENENCKKVLRGKNIKDYELNWNGEYVWYRPDLMKEKVGCVPHSKDLFEVKEKIVTQRVNSSMQLLVAYDDKQYYFLDTVNVSKVETLDAKYELKYLLALLNSKLINHWYCNKYRMPTIGLYELHSIPIKYAEKSIQKQIVNLVDIILKSDDASDKNRTKTLIDNMIYELYNLTQEEIIYLED